MDKNLVFTSIVSLFFILFIIIYFVVCCNKCLEATNYNERYVILANTVDNNPSNYLNQTNLENHNQNYENEKPPEYTSLNNINTTSSNILPINNTYQSFSNLPNLTSNQQNFNSNNTETISLTSSLDVNTDLNIENYRVRRYDYSNSNNNQNNQNNQSLPFYYQNLTIDERNMLNNPRGTYS